MSSMLTVIIEAAGAAAVIFAGCAYVTAPPRPLPLPQRRTPWNDVGVCRAAAYSRSWSLAQEQRDEAREQVRALEAEVRRLRARNKALAGERDSAAAAAETLAELQLPAAIELVRAYYARRVAGEGGEGEAGVIGGMLTLTPKLHSKPDDDPDSGPGPRF